MRVKRYIVDTMPEAMHKIRTELGNDAVILSSKELKVGGFMFMFQKKKIEVIAAVEAKEDKPAPRPAKSMSQPAPVARASVPAAYQKSARLLNSEEKEGLNSAEMRPADSQIEPELGPNVVHSASYSQESLKVEPTITQTSSSSSPPSSKPESLAEGNLSEERLFNELKQMKQMMNRLTLKDPTTADLPEALQIIQDHLVAQGIESTLAEAWITAALLMWNSEEASLSQARQLLQVQIGDFLLGRLGEGISASTKMVYIAGPTGVGKTTTIAKLAADQIFRNQKKVGFITADTYRISAIEQLRTYASILNVPLEVVQSPGDVQRAVQRLQYCDLIIMDTAGRNYLNELLVAELHSLLSIDEHSETYLVLSLTSKTEDMQKITEHFIKFGLDKVIFTKLDETKTCGSLFNLLHDYPVKLSYLTHGQNVPDDLLRADVALLVNQLLGEQGK
ncbi:flagellar biosynthesis protein FlhF [Paenibacillus shirakamiensis]|uniref:Flagellar biosynthesis protein FlhF n=1 Tax=Paenibacillus shirakamiensis TaxID=1265935 RepID=A0ABS4JJC9_9BACL|nr:flagellar biosynthesis protein FlhF [Paenibacillus shirakamiensis]MBP2001101.1 flagellar biosynthesis protein FlhF [Paenibacillus shirakamiensis]